MQTIEKQISTHMYYLTNEAKKHRFKAEDTWTTRLVTDTEPTRTRKDHYPVIANRLSPEVLSDFFYSIKALPGQPLSKEIRLIDGNSTLQSDLKYIIAFNFKRTR